MEEREGVGDVAKTRPVLLRGAADGVEVCNFAFKVIKYSAPIRGKTCSDAFADIARLPEEGCGVEVEFGRKESDEEFEEHNECRVRKRRGVARVITRAGEALGETDEAHAVENVNPSGGVDQADTTQRKGKEKARVANEMLVFEERTPECAINSSSEVVEGGRGKSYCLCIVLERTAIPGDKQAGFGEDRKGAGAENPQLFVRPFAPYLDGSTFWGRPPDGQAEVFLSVVIIPVVALVLCPELSKGLWRGDACLEEVENVSFVYTYQETRVQAVRGVYLYAVEVRDCEFAPAKEHEVIRMGKTRRETWWEPRKRPVLHE